MRPWIPGTNVVWAVAVALAVVVGAQTTIAAPGDLDPSFDVDGMVLAAWDQFPSLIGPVIAIQADGKIVVGKEFGSDSFSVLRYRADGRLDKSFGFGGLAVADPGTGDAECRALAIQGDGKIVEAGSFAGAGTFDVAVVRFNADGSLDSTFGGDGIVTTAIGVGIDTAAAVAIQNDGKIVVAGATEIAGNFDFAIVRYDADGTLDASFDGDGIVTTSVVPGSDGATAIAIQSDGAIVVSGYWEAGANVGFATLRYDANGALDASFDMDGIVTTDLGPNVDRANSVAIQADGGIVVAGESANGIDADFAVVRYEADGSLDTSFDVDGIVTTDFGVSSNRAYAAAVQGDGRIVVVGEVSDVSQANVERTDMAIVRYETDGSLDASFGSNGVVTTGFGFVTIPFVGTYAIAVAKSVAIQGDGKIAIAGHRFPYGEATSLVVARYSVTNCGDGVLDLGETCDDGALIGGDGCDAGCILETDCPSLPLPESSCLTATNHQLQIVRSDDEEHETRDRVIWRWGTMDSLAQAELAAPNDDTKYTLCIYDSTLGVSTLAVRLDIAPGDLWTSKSPKGWIYKDVASMPDGVQKAQIKTSYVGRASAKLSARGASLPLPAPVSGSEYFQQEPGVIVQLLNEEGLCLGGELTIADTRKNDATTFKAKAQ